MTTKDKVRRALKQVKRDLAAIGGLPVGMMHIAEVEPVESAPLAKPTKKNRGNVVFFLPPGCEESDP